MNKEKKANSTLEDVKIDVKYKLSILWTTIMFLYIYVDHFALFIPEVIEDIIKGKVASFQITQGWFMGAMILMTIPILMIFLSLVLKPRANRWTNIIVGVIYSVVVIGNVFGEIWAYYFFGSAIELVLLILIVIFAWKWPRNKES